LLELKLHWLIPDEFTHRFTLEVPEIVLIAVEIIPVTPEGFKSIDSVKV